MKQCHPNNDLEDANEEEGDEDSESDDSTYDMIEVPMMDDLANDDS